MTKQYEKPTINKLVTGMMNKYGEGPCTIRQVRSHIAGVAVEDLVARYGSPLFVFSENILRERYREAYEAFSTRYPNVTFGWSYKTNYLSAICGIFHQEGAMAEVVSEMEYDKARNLGVPGDKIILNGPHKRGNTLRRAISEGASVNLDNMDEVYELEELAEQMGHPLKVGFRLNMDTGISPQWSRFGFNLESGQAMNAIERISRKGKLLVNGLHCHIGTYIMDPNAYAVQAEKMVAFAYRMEERFGFRVDYLDLGGGFPSKSRLKGAYHTPDITLPPIDDYAAAVTGALYKKLHPGHFPDLILESGRALVDEAGYLVTTVLSSKRLPDGRRAYVADAGINLLYTSAWYRFNLEVDRVIKGPQEVSIVYGPLCMNIDVIRENVMLPPLEKGTRFILSPVGAYNVTQWMQFIAYRPGVVLIGENGVVDVIRDPEDLSDMERRERVPERLRPRFGDTGASLPGVEGEVGASPGRSLKVANM